MGTSDNNHVSNPKYRHYLMYFFRVSLFLLPHKLLSLSFSCLGHDLLRPNETNSCSKPRSTCCTPRRNRFETVKQNIFIFLRGRSFSIVFNSSVLPYFKPVNASEWIRFKEIGAQLFSRKGRAETGAEQLYWTFGLFWRFGTSALSPGNYLSGIQ